MQVDTFLEGFICSRNKRC